MIHIYIGPSGAGKTTLVRKVWLDGELARKVEPIPFTESRGGRVALLGHYGVGKRCEGTDTLSMAIGPKLRAALPWFCSHYEEVVMEGDRVTNAETIRTAIGQKQPTTLYLVTAPLQICAQRLVAAGSKIKLPFLKGRRTKSHRLFHEGVLVKREDLSCPDPGPAFSKVRGVAARLEKRPEPVMYWSDIEREGWFLDGINAPGATGMNVARSTTRQRARYARHDLHEWLRDQWNSPGTSGFSPLRYFGREAIRVAGTDDSGNVVYELKRIGMKHRGGGEE